MKTQRYFRGLFAEKALDKLKSKNGSGDMACGHFIDDMDYFEKEKLKQIREFYHQDIDEEIYVISHNDDLV